jgi:hypothetical protein
MPALAHVMAASDIGRWGKLQRSIGGMRESRDALNSCGSEDFGAAFPKAAVGSARRDGKEIGNLDTDMDAMMANSPLRRYRDRTTPLPWIHGIEGLRIEDLLVVTNTSGGWYACPTWSGIRRSWSNCRAKGTASKTPTSAERRGARSPGSCAAILAPPSTRAD